MVKLTKKLNQTNAITNEQLLEQFHNDTQTPLYEIDTTGSNIRPTDTDTVQSNKRKSRSTHKTVKPVVNKSNKPDKQEQLYDPWSTPLPDIQPHTNQYGYIDTPVTKPIIKYRTPAQYNAIMRGTKQSVLLNEISSGTSYNPDESKRQELLHYTNSILTKQAKHSILLQQAKSYNIDQYEKSDVSDSEDEWMNNEPTQHTKKQHKSKTKQQRTRQALHRQRLRIEHELQQRKQFNAALNQLPFIAAEVMNELSEKQQLQHKRHALKSQLNTEPRLGKRLIEPVIPTIALTNELSDTRSLRQLKPSLSTVKGLVQNYERRHLIEPFRRNDAKLWKRKKMMDKYQLKNRKLHVLPAGMEE